MESLKIYLQNTLVNQQAIESRTKHPILLKTYPKRFAYVLLEKYTYDFFSQGTEPRLISLTGLRGTGKTTLLWQIAQYIYKNHCKNIYFFNINILQTLGVDLYTTLQNFQQIILQKSFRELTEPIVLLFDEIQADEKWATTLKILYDEARTAFILCTGSSALLLNSTADLARRMKFEKIYPFKFTEFVTAKTFFETDKTIFPQKNLTLSLKEAIFYSNSCQEALATLQNHTTPIQTYWDKLNDMNHHFDDLQKDYIQFRNIPNFLAYKDDIAITEAISEMFKRVIYEDIPKIQPSFNEFSKIERLLLRLSGSDEINIESLSKSTGIKIQEINDLLNILAKAEILNILLPYTSFEGKILKNRKAFFMSPSLRRALLFTLYGENLSQFESKFLEDTLVMYLKRILPDYMISFHTAGKDANPDIIIETHNKPILLEIGSQKTTIEQLKKSAIDSRYNLLVTKGISQPQCKENTLLLPWSWFLLL